MITETRLKEVSDQIQNDLLAYLDGHDDEVLTQVCQFVVDGFFVLQSEVEDDVG